MSTPLLNGMFDSILLLHRTMWIRHRANNLAALHHSSPVSKNSTSNTVLEDCKFWVSPVTSSDPRIQVSSETSPHATNDQEAGLTNRKRRGNWTILSSQSRRHISPDEEIRGQRRWNERGFRMVKVQHDRIGQYQMVRHSLLAIQRSQADLVGTLRSSWWMDRVKWLDVMDQARRQRSWDQRLRSFYEPGRSKSERTKMSRGASGHECAANLGRLLMIESEITECTVSHNIADTA